MAKNIIVEVVSIASPIMAEEADLIQETLRKNNLTANFFEAKNTSLKVKPAHSLAICKAEHRFKQFKQAVENKDSKIIWCSRGGYGSAEILPFLYKMPKPKNKKIVVGFSDISSIAIFLQQQWNWQIICAPMLKQIARNTVSKNSQKIIFDLIKGKINKLEYDLDFISKHGIKKKISAPVVGGCLSVLSASFATKNQINWHNKILFLEDQNECAERLDRYFTQIAFVINETKLKPSAILLGNFFANLDKSSVEIKNIKIAIDSFSKKIGNIPLWQEKNMLLGHSFEQKPIIIGKEAEISTIDKITQKIDLSFFKKD